LIRIFKLENKIDKAVGRVSEGLESEMAVFARLIAEPAVVSSDEERCKTDNSSGDGEAVLCGCSDDVDR
jgi:hypothetical protein